MHVFFWKKAVNSPQRWRPKPSLASDSCRLSPDPHFVFNTKDFNTPYSSCFNI